jgi:hypothetical protein
MQNIEEKNLNEQTEQDNFKDYKSLFMKERFSLAFNKEFRKIL